MVSRASAVSLISLATLGIVATPSRARAADPFEIQVYDGTANDPGVAGLELHVNHVLRGVRAVEAPLLAPDRQTHFTLEPSLGITPFWELGAYFQTSLRGDGHFDYAGTKLRSKFVTPPAFSEHVRLGLNFELARIPETFSEDAWGVELRPIVAFENERWLLAANPIVSVSVAGCRAGCGGPEFEPAAAAYLKIPKVAAIGFEYYGSLGPLKKFSPRSAQVHYLFAATNLLVFAGWEVNAAVGRGLTTLGGSSNEYVIKTILGHELGKSW